jgi:hypothetical protein
VRKTVTISVNLFLTLALMMHSKTQLSSVFLPAVNNSWKRASEVITSFSDLMNKTKEISMFMWNTMVRPTKILELTYHTPLLRILLKKDRTVMF